MKEQLVARREFCLFIAAELKWKCQKEEELNQVVDLCEHSPDTQILGQFEIEICLLKSRSAKLGRVDTSNYLMNEALLTDQAFSPKSFFLTLETGIFSTVDGAKLRRKRGGVPKYPYRLRFDQSPYPSRPEWKDPTGAPDGLKFWEWTDFCRGQPLDMNNSSSKEKTVLAMIRRFSRKLWH